LKHLESTHAYLEQYLKVLLLPEGIVSKTMNMRQGLIFIEASGFSMRPFLWGGEKLIVKKTNTTELKTGDLIVYRRVNDGFVCHRFLRQGIKNKHVVFLTQGDSIPCGREEVFCEQMIGKVVGILKGQNTIDLTAWKWRLMNHVAFLLTPLTSRIIQQMSFIKKRFW